VGNVVQANILAMDAPGVAGNSYNVACGESVTLNRLVTELRDLTGCDIDAVHAAPRAGDIRHSLADLSRTSVELGYEPSVRLREGLQLTIDHLRAEQRFSERATSPSA
jgi:UDP-glucose 4-epimerase